MTKPVNAISLVFSDSLAQFAPALAKAQSEMKGSKKDSETIVKGGRKSKYSSLESVLEAIEPCLNKHGISIIQTPCLISPEHDIITIPLTTMLLHESGEWMMGTLEIPLLEFTPQGLGLAVSYGRRYGAAAMCGIYQEDDDGNEALQSTDRGARGADATLACTVCGTVVTANVAAYSTHHFGSVLCQEHRHRSNEPAVPPKTTEPPKTEALRAATNADTNSKKALMERLFAERDRIYGGHETGTVEDKAYRAYLKAVYSVDTVRNMTVDQIEGVIDAMSKVDVYDWSAPDPFLT